MLMLEPPLDWMDSQGIQLPRDRQSHAWAKLVISVVLTMRPVGRVGQ